MLLQMALCIFNKREQAQAAAREPGEGGAGTGGFRGGQAAALHPPAGAGTGLLLRPGARATTGLRFCLCLRTEQVSGRRGSGRMEGVPGGCRNRSCGSQGPS